MDDELTIKPQVQDVKFRNQQLNFQTKNEYTDWGCHRITRQNEVKYNVAVVTGNYTARLNDYYIRATTSSSTVTIPDNNIGKKYLIKNGSGGVVTVAPISYNIDGSSTKTLAAGFNWVEILFDGIEWAIVSEG